MAYDESKTDWDEDAEFTTEELNRIEGNIEGIKDENITFQGDKVFTGIIDADVSSDSTSTIVDQVAYTDAGYTYKEFTIEQPCTIYGVLSSFGTIWLECKTDAGYLAFIPTSGLIASSASSFAVALNPGVYRMKALGVAGYSGTAYVRRVGMYGGGSTL